MALKLINSGAVIYFCFSFQCFWSSIIYLNVKQCKIFFQIINKYFIVISLGIRETYMLLIAVITKINHPMSQRRIQISFSVYPVR